MAYTSEPWTIQKQPAKSKKVQKETAQSEKIQNKTEENLPVAAARVVTFLNKNKNKCFTNKQIAAEIGISTSSASGIMDKLEEIGCVKVAKIRKNANSGISQVYQSYDGNSIKVEKEREVEGCIARVLAIFNKNINKVYSSKKLSSELEIPRNRIGQALSILLVTGKIKVVGIENKLPVYQNIKGNKPFIEIASEPDKNYMTFENYLDMNNIKDDIKKLKEKIASEKGHTRLFYSNQGFLREYEISYLQKVIGNGKEEKKGLLERIKVW